MPELKDKKDGRFLSLFTPEQEDIFYAEITKLARKYNLTALGNKGVVKKLLKMKDEDGNCLFYDCRGENPDKTQPANFNSVLNRYEIVLSTWRKVIAPRLRAGLIEATVAQVEKARKSPASLKVVAAIIEPEEEKKGVEVNIHISAELKALLLSLESDTLQTFPQSVGAGKDNVHACPGDKGHALPLPGDISAPGCIADKEVSLPDDRTVHVGDRNGGLQGSVVPCATGVSEDNADNTGGDDMVDITRPEHESDD